MYLSSKTRVFISYLVLVKRQEKLSSVVELARDDKMLQMCCIIAIIVANSHAMSMRVAAFTQGPISLAVDTLFLVC